MIKVTYIGPSENPKNSRKNIVMSHIFEIGEIYVVRDETSTAYKFEGFIFPYPKDSFRPISYKDIYNLI